MQALPSVMDHTFAKVPQALIQRSSFDRSHGVKTTFNTGYLVPFYIDEALPGDTFNLNATLLARISSNALLKPIMDNMYLETFFFFVPNRLLWDNWQKFMGAQDNPGDSTTYTVPQIASPTSPGVLTDSLADHFGLPVGLSTSFSYNALHTRAYAKIWNEWFRDQNMQNSVTVATTDGPDTTTSNVLLKRGKRHDYFTSCLTNPQKGTAATVSLGTTAAVRSLGASFPPAFLDGGGGTDRHLKFNSNATPQWDVAATGAATAYFSDSLSTASGLYADLANATGPTINSLRQAIALQQMLEVDMRGGTRYTEVIRAHFGVISPDARLQRSEFLGSGKSNVNVNPVAGTNNVGTGATAPSTLTAFATTHGSGHGFTMSFTEHGVLLGLACVYADLTYQQGLNRMFSRRTKYDYYWPTLSSIGEQAVLNQEIYCAANGGGGDTLTFGYQERYAEYRYKPSEIHGVFRSNCSTGVTSLEVYHLSQNFGSLPALGDTFVKETVPLSRTLAVATGASSPEILMDGYISLRCARPMPVYAVPGLTRL